MISLLASVRDVAEAHDRAAKHGVPGERYLVTGDVLMPEALSAAFTTVVGYGPKVMTPPQGSQCRR